MDQLVSNVLRLASSDEEFEVQNRKKMKRFLSPMIDNVEVLATYLDEVNEMDEEKAESYIQLIKAEAENDPQYAEAWNTLVQAASDIEEMENAGDGEEEEDFSIDDELSEPVISPDQVDKTASFDAVLFNEDTENPHYSVFANGKPLAEISLLNQEKPAQLRETFLSDDYAEHLVKTLKEVGPAETLRAVNASFYTAQIESGKLMEKAASTVENELEKEYTERVASLKENFLNTVNLVVLAANKGQFLKNKLRVELKRAFREAGVQDPGTIIDEVWQEAAPDFFNDVFAKAEEWMGYTPEGLHEITKEVLGSDSAAELENQEIADEDYLEEERRASASGTFRNVPIITGTAASLGDNTDIRNHYKRVMNFGSRFRSKLLAHKNNN